MISYCAVVLFGYLVFWHFLGELPPRSQINTRRFILSFDCPALAWLIFSQLFLNYHKYLLTLCSLLFLLLYMLHSLLLGDWLDGFLAWWLALDIFFPLFSLLLVSPSIYTRLQVPPLLVPTSLLVIQLFIRTISCLKQEKNHSFT